MYEVMEKKESFYIQHPFDIFLKHLPTNDRT